MSEISEMSRVSEMSETSTISTRAGKREVGRKSLLFFLLLLFLLLSFLCLLCLLCFLRFLSFLRFLLLLLRWRYYHHSLTKFTTSINTTNDRGTGSTSGRWYFCTTNVVENGSWNACTLFCVLIHFLKIQVEKYGKFLAKVQ